MGPIGYIEMGTLKGQLEALFPEKAESWKGCKHPPYSDLSIEETYEKFCEELSETEIVDPREISISIEEDNFPKLLNLKFVSTGKNVKARKTLELLRSESFDASLYTFEKGRIRTIFWVTDVLKDPDKIVPNTNPIIEGAEVYLKHYDKLGSPIKLVFIKIGHAGQRVIVTSFLTSPNDLNNYIGGKPLYVRPKNEGTP